MLLWGLFLCLTSPFIIIQPLSEYTLSPNKLVLLQRAKLGSQAGSVNTRFFTCLTSFHYGSNRDGFEGVRPQVCTKPTPLAGSGNPRAQTGCAARERRRPAGSPAAQPVAREAGGPKRSSGVLAVHSPGRNQPEQAWKAQPFYSPELRLWLDAGTGPKLHLKCFRQPICARFGSLRSACRGPLLTGARRRQGGKKGVRTWVGRGAPWPPPLSGGPRSPPHPRPRRKASHGALQAAPGPHVCQPGQAQGAPWLPWGSRAGSWQPPRVGWSLGSAPPAPMPAPGHGHRALPSPLPPLSLPRPPWSFLSPRTSW